MVLIAVVLIAVVLMTLIPIGRLIAFRGMRVVAVLFVVFGQVLSPVLILLAIPIVVVLVIRIVNTAIPVVGVSRFVLPFVILILTGHDGIGCDENKTQ